MNLIRKIKMGILGLAPMLTLFSCSEGSGDSYYWYSTYQIFENTTDNRPYYTFYVELFNLEDKAIETKKEDFKVTDKNGSYSPAGFVTSYSFASIKVNGVTTKQYDLKMADSFTFQKESDGQWNNVMVAFADNFDKESAKISYKNVDMVIRPGYSF